MNVLIAYGTTEGQTRKIAEYVGDRVSAEGGTAELYDCERHASDLQLTDFDTVIVVASIHHQAHPESVLVFVEGHLDTLKAKPTLFLSVSLSAGINEKREEAQNYADNFLAQTGWLPTKTHLVAGALRVSQYDYFEEQIVEHVVLKGSELEGETGDRELTDWDDLAKTVSDFLRTAGAP